MPLQRGVCPKRRTSRLGPVSTDGLGVEIGASVVLGIGYVLIQTDGPYTRLLRGDKSRTPLFATLLT